jgi:hypothetical protein
MDVRLMHPDRALDLAAPEPRGSSATAADLELDLLWDAMAAGDAFVRSVVRAVTLRPATDEATIAHRHAVLADCRADPDLVAELEAVTARAVTAERRAASWLFGRTPQMALRHAVQVLGLLADDLDELRAVVERHAGRVRSAGWQHVVATVRRDLDDAYLAELRDQVDHLALQDGLVASAHLDVGGTVTGVVLRRGRPENRRRLRHNPLHRPTLSWTVPDRDEGGFRALGELQDRAVAAVAVVALRAAEHVQSFFDALRTELAFYRACLNLDAVLAERGVTTCLPATRPLGEATLLADAVYDPCLVLRTGRPAVANDVRLDGRALLVVTGANHGGKSTLLRALGVLQLMAQAGMPVAARACTLGLVTGVHTHWAREEDAELRHGKLDEELVRMSAIVEDVRPGALLLSNESFSSTNEVEGSAIALGVVRALLDAGVRVHLVTHLYDLASDLLHDESRPGVFLRAPRQSDAAASYRLEPGEPLSTSFGRDLYERVFGEPASA